MAKRMLSAVVSPSGPESKADGHQQIATDLERIFTDSYVLMMKTQVVHWNATGPMFVSVHQLTEEHYKDLFDAIDDLAERLRALGHPAPSSIDEIIPPGSFGDGLKDVGTERMVSVLAKDHRDLSARLRSAIEIAEERSDAGTADLMTERLRFHDKAAWMLQAMID